MSSERNEQGASSCGPNGSFFAEEADEEAEFYEVMAGALGADKIRDCSEWLFDAGDGSQVGATPDGNVVMMLVMTPAVKTALVGALENWRDHAASEAIDVAMSMLLVVGTYLSKA